MAGRKTLRELLSENENLILPGILSPIEALLAEKADFKACYISGAALSTSLGFLDEGKITLARITSLVREIRRASDMPLLVDFSKIEGLGIDHDINSSLEIEGEYERNERIDRFYREPKLKPADYFPNNIKLLSLDIETDCKGGKILYFPPPL